MKRIRHRLWATGFTYSMLRQGNRPWGVVIYRTARFLILGSTGAHLMR